jgi:glutamate-1-semialdehyde 2,1-aminomutase
MAVDVRTEATRAAVEAEILANYRARTAGSAARHEAARRVMPGGDTRTVAFHAPYPLYLAEGQGCRVQDVDGNRYLDLLNNYTSLIHGHAHPAVTEAVAAQTPRGTAFAAGFEAQIRLAELLTDRVSSVDLIRFCNSGTEAVMNALRAARAFTGRDVIVKMEGGYHGTYDDIEVSVHPDLAEPAAGPDHAPRPVLDVQGVPRNTVDNVLVLPFNDVPAAERLLTERGGEIAAVIVEPVMGSGGLIPAEHDFLAALRALTVEQGIVLIFDEVMTFRLEPGGVQEHYRIRPDLTTFAKIIGGGFPVGAFGGREAIMAQFDPSRPRPLWQSGTFNGNAITMVAGIAAMERYPAAEVARINGLGDRLRAGLGRLLIERNVPGEATGYGSFVNLHLTARGVRNYRTAAAGDRALQRLMHLALLAEGVFAAPRLLCCTSTAMDAAVVDEAIAAFGRALDRIGPAIAEVAGGARPSD